MKSKSFLKYEWQAGFSALGLSLAMAIAGAAGVYFNQQHEQTLGLIRGVSQSRQQSLAKQINMSSFALARSLLNFRNVGAGPSKHLVSALYADNYFDGKDWKIRLNPNLGSQTNHWSFSEADEVLTIKTPVASELSESAKAQAMMSAKSLSEVASGNALADTKITFGRVDFEEDPKGLSRRALSIDVRAETTFKTSQGQTVNLTNFARIPLDMPEAYQPYIIIYTKGSNPNTAYDTRFPLDARPGSSSANPLPASVLVFELHSSGVSNIVGNVYMTMSPDYTDLESCIKLGDCSPFQADDTYVINENRAYNVLAEDQKILSFEKDYSTNYTVLAAVNGSQNSNQGNGSAKGDGSTCSVETADGKTQGGVIDNSFFSSFKSLWGLSGDSGPKTVYLFARMYNPDGVTYVDSGRSTVYVSPPITPAVEADKINETICGGSANPCKTFDNSGTVTGEGLMAQYNSGKNPKTGRWPLMFSQEHQKVWTEKMGVTDIKLCIDNSQSFDKIAKACPAPINDAAGAACFSANYEQHFDIFYIHPVTCQPEFLYQRTACGCFEGSTPIMLGDGRYKPIRELTRTDMIWNPILKKAMAIKRMVVGPEKIPMIRVTRAGDSAVLVTQGHPFPTENGLKTAIELKNGDRVFNASGGLESVTVETVVYPEAEAPSVWNLELDGDEHLNSHYLVADGVVTGDLKIQERLKDEKERLSLAAPVANP